MPAGCLLLKAVRLWKEVAISAQKPVMSGMFTGLDTPTYKFTYFTHSCIVPQELSVYSY
jgi:hypothetical protein